MEEEIIFKGLWFLPSNPERKLNGVLTFKPFEAHSELELYGHIDYYSENNEFEIIHGTTFDDKIITLHKCIVVYFSGFSDKESPENKKPSKILVSFIFGGVHFLNSSDLFFKNIQANIFNLEHWVNIDGFSSISNSLTRGGDEISNFNYNRPKSIEFKIDEQFNGAINFNLSPNFDDFYTKQYRFTQDTSLEITSVEHIPFLELLDKVYIFQNFIVSSLFVNLYHFNITVKSDNYIYVSRVMGDLKIPIPIKLYIGHQKNFQSKKPKKHFDMFFTYDDIEQDFPEIIKKWYSKYNDLSYSFNLFFSSFYTSDNYIDGMFLNLMQATEAFHYHLNLDKKLLDENEWKARKKELKENLTPELYDWINSQLRNDYFLGKRLDELIANYTTDLVIKNIGDVPKFLSNLKNTRNYLTHYNPELKKKSLNGIELVQAYRLLRMILICAFYIECGFDRKFLDSQIRLKGQRFFGLITREKNY